MKTSATGKRRFKLLIGTNLAIPSGFSSNQLEPRNSNSSRIFWTDLVCCKSDLLVFCASKCDCNLVCATKYFFITFFRNYFFVLATLKALWQGRNNLWVRILNNLLSVLQVKSLSTCKFVVGFWHRDLYIWWEIIRASSMRFLVLRINYVQIVEEFNCGGLTLGSHLYIYCRK